MNGVFLASMAYDEYLLAQGSVLGSEALFLPCMAVGYVNGGRMSNLLAMK